VLPKRIIIEFIDQKDQRYDTVGDYGETEDGVWFKITKFEENPMRSIYVLMHEMWEFFRNKQLGISVEDVDDFDLSHPELDDPGLSPNSPYHKTHMESDAIERLCCVLAQDDWVDYESEIESIFKGL